MTKTTPQGLHRNSHLSGAVFVKSREDVSVHCVLFGFVDPQHSIHHEKCSLGILAPAQQVCYTPLMINETFPMTYLYKKKMYRKLYILFMLGIFFLTCALFCVCVYISDSV